MGASDSFVHPVIKTKISKTAAVRSIVMVCCNIQIDVEKASNRCYNKAYEKMIVIPSQ